MLLCGVLEISVNYVSEMSNHKIPEMCTELHTEDEYVAPHRLVGLG